MMSVGDPFANIRRLIRTPVEHQRTFQIDQPLETHFRRATCQEVECKAYAFGWKMGFDLTDPDKVAAARAIRDKSGRTFTVELVDALGPNPKVILTFAAGQRCFQTHRVPLEREPFYIVRGGDFRGNPRRERTVHRTADSFVDRWDNELSAVKEVLERG